MGIKLEPLISLFQMCVKNSQDFVVQVSGESEVNTKRILDNAEGSECTGDR